MSGCFERKSRDITVLEAYYAFKRVFMSNIPRVAHVIYPSTQAHSFNMMRAHYTLKSLVFFALFCLSIVWYKPAARAINPAFIGIIIWAHLRVACSTHRMNASDGVETQ